MAQQDCTFGVFFFFFFFCPRILENWGESGRQRVTLQMVAAEIQSIVLNWTFPKLKWDAGYIFGESYFADNIRSEKILGDNLVQILHFKAQKTDVQKGEATCSWLYNKTIDILGPETKFPICSAGIFSPGDIGELSIQIKTLSRHDLQGSDFFGSLFFLEVKIAQSKVEHSGSLFLVGNTWSARTKCCSRPCPCAEGVGSFVCVSLDG